MTILVLGNGFDIAHGLPTKYSNFLQFLDAIRSALEYGEHKETMSALDEKLGKLNPAMADMIKKNMESAPSGNSLEGNLFEQADMWHNLMDKKYWIGRFEKIISGEKWIDFEEVIKETIIAIDSLIKLTEKNGNQLWEEPVILKFSSKLGLLEKDKINKKNIIDRLLCDLNRLTRLLEIYLSEYVSRISNEDKLRDIENITPQKVLCFNYTKTYEKLYGTDGIEFDYYHGLADASRSYEDNDMVLGIDEYLDDSEKDKDLAFVEFKKYYQRQIKNSERKADTWGREILEDGEVLRKTREFLVDSAVQLEALDLRSQFPNVNALVEDYERLYRERIDEFDKLHPKHQVVFYGHSLGVTDKDIIRKLILNPNTNTKIFYHSKESYSSLIKNLIRIIGQEEFNSRTGGKDRSIWFVETKSK